MKQETFWTRCSVDEIPGRWQPLFWLYSYSVAAGFFLYYAIVSATSRVRIHGQEHLDRGRGYLFTCWHDRFPIYLATRPRHDGQVWMIFAAWYMKPMHILACWSGVTELVYGATHHSGVEAAKILVGKLAPGRSTVFLPDGPFSRPRQVRKGLLHMARDSGLAIVPMKLQASRELRLRTWDRKAVPLPFCRIELRYGPPIQVTAVNTEALAALEAALA